MSLQAIHVALSASLAAFAASQSPALSVAYEDRSFDPPDGLYLREALLPAGTRQAALGTDAPDYVPGIYQVDVVAPGGQGFGAYSAVVDALAAHFRRTTLATSAGFSLRVTTVNPGPALKDESGRTFIPVSINFYAYVPV